MAERARIRAMMMTPTTDGTTRTNPPAPPKSRTASLGRVNPQPRERHVETRGEQVDETRVDMVARRSRGRLRREGGCLEGARLAVRRAWRWVRATALATINQLRRRRTLAPARAVLCRELERAERGEPRLERDEVNLTGGRVYATAAASARATRAPATLATARTGLRQLVRFIEANPRLLAARVPVSGDVYDIAVEAWLLARCGGDVSPWRAEGAGTGGARIGGTVRALLDRLGYSRGTAWTRAITMAQALGAGDREDTQHHLPIFVWEVVEALRMRPPCSLWESAAAALVVLGALAARRKGGAALLLTEQVTQTGPDTVSIAPRHRPKPRRQRVQAQRTSARVVVVSHWLIAQFVVPWLEWHRRRSGPTNGYLFPSIVASARARVRTAVGYAVGSSWWVEPLRGWSQDAITAAVHRCLLNPDGRTYQGLRVGNNIELTRNSDRVSSATRRTLHERSLAPLIGSETAYVESFAEDFANATRLLGRLRIVRRPDGLLSVIATSQSAGQSPADWVVVQATADQHFPMPHPVRDVDECDSDTSSNADVVGDGDRSTRSTICGRCGRRLAAQDYGFLCDYPDCPWACCVDCHPEGARAPLWCPPHLAGRAAIPRR
jgi:hypothetical protein